MRESVRVRGCTVSRIVSVITERTTRLQLVFAANECQTRPLPPPAPTLGARVLVRAHPMAKPTINPNELGDLVPRSVHEDNWPSLDMGPKYQEQLSSVGAPASSHITTYF